MENYCKSSVSTATYFHLCILVGHRLLLKRVSLSLFIQLSLLPPPLCPGNLPFNDYVRFSGLLQLA